jgi:S1/P1 Nuclease
MSLGEKTGSWKWGVRFQGAFRVVVFGAAMLGVGVKQGWAWGREGHRLTALVADQYLTPAAKAQVATLLAGQTLEDVAPWADSYRVDHPETAPWHFVDIPANQEKFDRQRDCPVSASDPKSPWRDCVTDRILYFEGRLGDTTLPASERAIALKFIVHLIGDVHQPFHALGDSRGGNELRMTFLGSQQCGTYVCNLHGVWDDSIIEEHRLSEEKYLQLLLSEIQQNGWERMAGGEPTTWANISHHYAVQALAPNGAVLNKDYYAEESKIVDAQLALGGLRLAHVLNRILGDTPPQAAMPATNGAPAAAPQ